MNQGRGRSTRGIPSRWLGVEQLEERRVLAALLVTSSADSGVGSLREAIQLANSTPGMDTILFDPSIAGLTIQLTTTELTVTESLIIDATGLPATLDVDLSGADPTPGVHDGLGIRGFVLDDGNPATASTFEISNLRIFGGDAIGSGGGIHSRESLVLDDVTLEDNHASLDGGGLYVEAGQDVNVSVQNVLLTSNVAGRRGGAAAGQLHDAGRWEMQSVSVSGNTASTMGGGLFVQSIGESDFYLSEATVTGNQAGPTGGGIMLDGQNGGRQHVLDSVIDDNFAFRGGGLFAYAQTDSQIVVQDSSANGNQAFAGGGGFYGQATSLGSVRFLGLTAVDNETTEEIGGGIAARTFPDGNIEISHAQVRGNRALLGGGISLFMNSGTTSVEYSTVENNSARSSGGGISVNAFGSSAATITNSTVSTNEADGNGGGIWVASSGGSFELQNSTISGNRTARSGGGVYVTAGFQPPEITQLRHLTIADNRAQVDPIMLGTGGGLSVSPFTTPTLANSILADNQVDGVPGDLDGYFFANYNLVEHPENITLVGAGNDLGVDPLLSPLSINGGPTRTHALAAGSPAIDAGDPTFVAPPEFDQRGMPFARVEFGRIDLGALEVSPIPDGDFDNDGDYDALDIDALILAIAAGLHDPGFDLTQDGIVDLVDRDAWLMEAGQFNLGVGKSYMLGDANLDGVVDGQDFIDWNNHKFQATARWSAADFDANGFTDGQDFIIWNTNKFMTTANLIEDIDPQAPYDSDREWIIDGIWSGF